MSDGSSTFRTVHDHTISESRAVANRLQLQELIVAEWRRTSQPDLVNAIEQYSQLLHDQSLLLNLALEEYKSLRTQADVIDLQQHCQRFERFGSSVERSIFRQLQTQKYLDEHPELLDLLSSPLWPEIGEDFGGFIIEEELGRGGISRVYLCQEREIGDRPVVIKVSPLTSIEASVLGRLSHPNIVPIHSTGRVAERDLSFICMPYLGRNTLADIIDVAFDRRVGHCGSLDDLCRRSVNNLEFIAPRGRRAWWNHPVEYFNRVLELVMKIGDALDCAHRGGIIHGDLKPSNILLSHAGDPLLLDFNLSQDRLNPATWWGGTLPYMPPEHLEKVARNESLDGQMNFDIRTDIYSFAAVVYELLTGEPPGSAEPQAGDRSDVARQLLENLRSSGAQIRKKCQLMPRSLERVLCNSLSIDPEERPSSVNELMRAFARENTLVPKMTRIATARPITTSILTGSVVLAGCVIMGISTMRPPAYLSEFRRGVTLLSAGDVDGAMDRFRRSVVASPDFVPARFELAKLKLMNGDIEGAIMDFDLLARTHDHIHSLAYLGYCHNLSGKPMWAIPLYLEAIERGFDSIAVYNNLAASYLAVPATLPPEERIKKPEALLLAALRMDSKAAAVRGNLILLEVARSNLEKDYFPANAIPHVLVLKVLEPDSDWGRGIVATWLIVVNERRETDEDWINRHEKDLDSIRTWVHPVLSRPGFATILASNGITERAISTGKFAMDSDGLRRSFMEPR